MRKNTLLLLASLAAAAPVLAQSDDDKKPASQPVENLYFSTDEYIAIPQYTFNYGYRALTGAKAAFGGSAVIRNLNVNVGADSLTDPRTTRVYNDGGVGPDTRTDANGRDLPSDGTTNNWGYNFDSQVTNYQGVGDGIAFHSYTATVVDEGPMSQNMGNSLGMEVTVSRDLPKLGRYLHWNITGGVSLNDLRQGLDTAMLANVSTVTHWYYLNGYTAPGADYSTPSTSSVTLVGGNGTTTSNSTSVTTTTHISEVPDAAWTTNTSNVSGVLNSRYRLKGSYYSLRVGPQFIVPFSAKFHVSFSVGALMVFAGSNFLVDNEYIPTKEEALITKTDSSYDTFVRPGYYLDANLEYWVTERSGIFAGYVFQSSGSFTQTIANSDIGQEANYSTRVDLSAQMGMRLGMNYRF